MRNPLSELAVCAQAEPDADMRYEDAEVCKTNADAILYYQFNK